ncbi:hypothetical protein CSKR_110925 [Clonorchis sinensis]|uniref:Uncharacterized protein n=1 Tax=Clonorchis sinensis TaxID=79923 RepID=A0A3R7C6Q4_CLOSI|nr:hypothetical protein CSKR_110925 [Clonorchis sinensis]
MEGNLRQLRVGSSVMEEPNLGRKLKRFDQVARKIMNSRTDNTVDYNFKDMGSTPIGAFKLVVSFRWNLRISDRKIEVRFTLTAFNIATALKIRYDCFEYNKYTQMDEFTEHYYCLNARGERTSDVLDRLPPGIPFSSSRRVDDDFFVRLLTQEDDWTKKFAGIPWLFSCRWKVHWTILAEAVLNLVLQASVSKTANDTRRLSPMLASNNVYQQPARSCITITKLNQIKSSRDPQQPNNMHYSTKHRTVGQKQATAYNHTALQYCQLTPTFDGYSDIDPSYMYVSLSTKGCIEQRYTYRRPTTTVCLDFKGALDSVDGLVRLDIFDQMRAILRFPLFTYLQSEEEFIKIVPYQDFLSRIIKRNQCPDKHGTNSVRQLGPLMVTESNFDGAKGYVYKASITPQRRPSSFHPFLDHVLFRTYYTLEALIHLPYTSHQSSTPMWPYAKDIRRQNGNTSADFGYTNALQPLALSWPMNMISSTKSISFPLLVIDVILPFIDDFGRVLFRAFTRNNVSNGYSNSSCLKFACNAGRQWPMTSSFPMRRDFGFSADRLSNDTITFHFFEFSVNWIQFNAPADRVRRGVPRSVVPQCAFALLNRVWMQLFLYSLEGVVVVQYFIRICYISVYSGSRPVDRISW